MQRREYRKQTSLAIFQCAGGVMFLAVGGVMLVATEIVSGHFELGGLIFGILLVSGGPCLIVYALRDGLLIVDDTGLHLRETFRSRDIPWDAVRAFQVKAAGKGVWPQAILRTNKVTMGIGDAGERDARRIVAELTEALREHTESADTPGDGQAP